MTNGVEVPRRPGGMMRNFIHLGMGQAATSVLAILLSGALARMLTAADFGSLYLVTSIATFTFVVAEWGQSNIIIREAARHPEKAGNLLGSALVVRVVIALGGSALAVGATWLLGYDAHTRLLAPLLILCWIPQYLALSFGWVFRARERMDRDALTNVALKLATLLVTITCLKLGGHLVEVVLSWSAAGAFALLIASFLYRRLQLPPIKATIEMARTLLRDGAPLVLMSLTVFLEPLLNTNIVFRLTSPTVVGWLGAAWTIAGTLLAPATVLSAAMYPRLSVTTGNPAEFRRAFENSMRPALLLSVLGAAGTYLFADVPIALIYGLEKFGPAAQVLRAFSPVLLLMYLDMFVCTAAVAAGRAGRLAAYKITSVVITTGLSFLLVPIFQRHTGNGAVGVMYAMAVGEALMLAGAFTLVGTAIDRRVVNPMLRTLAAGGATVTIFLWLPRFSPFLAIPACIALFAGMALLAGAVQRAEVRALVSALRH
jgi:O-antigen/teichoic acid export membrane protein